MQEGKRTDFNKEEDLIKGEHELKKKKKKAASHYSTGSKTFLVICTIIFPQLEACMQL